VRVHQRESPYRGFFERQKVKLQHRMFAGGWSADLVSPGGTNEKIHLYLGLADLGETGGLHGLKDEGEDIRVTRLSVADGAIALKAGRINNATTIMALQWLLLNKEQMAT